MSAPDARTSALRPWADSRAEWPAHYCAASFQFSVSFKIPEICGNF
jgi:hypothetical protein